MDLHTIRMPEDLLDELAEEAEEKDMSRAEYIRSLLRQRTEYAELRRENERLRNEKRNVVNQREEHGELVAYVEEEREIQRRREDREERREQRRQSPAWRRAWWWLTGRRTTKPRERPHSAFCDIFDFGVCRWRTEN